MRLRVVDLEGSADEFSRLPDDVKQALVGLVRNTDGAGTAPALGDEALDEEDSTGEGAVGLNHDNELPKEVRDFISVRAGGVATAELVQKWVKEVLGWGTTVVEIGRSRITSDGYGNYLLLYAKGPRRFGAFAYVRPGNAKVSLRLLADSAEGYEHTEIRNVKTGNGYEVVVPLRPDDAYKEALALAEVALEGVVR